MFSSFWNLSKQTHSKVQKTSKARLKTTIFDYFHPFNADNVVTNTKQCEHVEIMQKNANTTTYASSIVLCETWFTCVKIEKLEKIYKNNMELSIENVSSIWNVNKKEWMPGLLENDFSGKSTKSKILFLLISHQID